MILAKPINLLNLPNELLEHIFHFMPYHVLLYFSHTCRKLREIIRDQPLFQKNLKHLEIIYQTRILHCTNNLDFLEDFPKTVIDEGFDHTISPAVTKRFNQIKTLDYNLHFDSKIDPINPIIIKFCESLEYLVLRESVKIKDFSFIKNLVNLNYLAMINIQIKDLSFLEKLVNLTNLLFIYSNQDLDLSFLKKVVQLKYLNLNGCYKIKDIQALEKLVNLKHLNLGDLFLINNISYLAKLVNLTQLYLWNCNQIGDISALAKLVKLLKLDLSGCTQIQDISPLAKLINLQELNLYGCTGLTQDHINDLKLKLPKCIIKF